MSEPVQVILEVEFVNLTLEVANTTVGGGSMTRAEILEELGMTLNLATGVATVTEDGVTRKFYLLDTTDT